jgi:hypothetical protein
MSPNLTVSSEMEIQFEFPVLTEVVNGDVEQPTELVSGYRVITDLSTGAGFGMPVDSLAAIADE